jgi:sulfotransferase
MSEMGIVGQSYTGLKQALMEGKQKNLHFVEYEDLVTNTEATMRKLYEFLGEEYYEAHDYENLENVHKENDAEVYGFSDMHDIRKSVGKSGINPEEFLPESILKACEGSEFWRSIEEDVDNNENTYQESVTEVDNNSSTSNEKLIGA